MTGVQTCALPISAYLIENGLENFEFEGMGYNDLLDLFKQVARYRAMLEQLAKRYSLIEVLKYLIENSDLVNLEFATLYEKVKLFLEARGYNILSKTVNETKIQLFVQTNAGLEELIIDEELFASPYFSESTFIFTKLKERDLTLFEGRDLIELLEEIESLAKKRCLYSKI